MMSGQVETKRTGLFTMRMSEEDTARFARVAAHYSLNLTAVIRMLMKREDDAIGGAPARRAPKKRARAKAPKGGR